MHVYVFGLGHIGLPIAVWIALSGLRVSGIDNNQKVIEDITHNRVNIYEKYGGRHISDIVFELIQEGRMRVKSCLERTDQEPAVFIITVGISDDGNGHYNLEPLQEVLDGLLPQLIPGDLLLFKTTMIPGICEEYIAPQINSLDIPVYLAYSPETISETNAFEELQNNPRILAALNEESYIKAEEFLKLIASTPIYRATNIKTAEMAKVVQNISRDVNIALVNEMAEAAKVLDIDINELRYLANTHPRVELLQPGPGVGGYCLPNAIGYLKTALPDKSTAKLTLTDTARKLNQNRPLQVVELVCWALSAAGKTVNRAKIAIVGLAMKDYCADLRYSPAVDMAAILLEYGAQIKAYDPLVPHSYPYQVDSFNECIAKADCLIIAAKQSEFIFRPEEIKRVMQEPPIVIDTRNIFPDAKGIKLYKF